MLIMNKTDYSSAPIVSGGLLTAAVMFTPMGTAPERHVSLVCCYSHVNGPAAMFMHCKETENQKQETDWQQHTMPDQRPKGKHHGIYL